MKNTTKLVNYRSILSSVFIFLCVIKVCGQCSCTDCPVTLTNSTVQSTLNISGATNSILGQNGQYLRTISVTMSPLEVGEYQINLISPSGDIIVLSTSNNPISGTDEQFFNICFTSCDLTPIPYTGTDIFFDSSEGYLPLTPYFGSYYPIQSLGPPFGSLGCLETLTGSVNGDWVLESVDEFPSTTQDGGFLANWVLEFADNTGTTCIMNQCSLQPPSCDLVEYGFEVPLPQVFCEGDPILDFSINPSYYGTPGDPSIYGIKFFVIDANTGLIEEISLTEPDLTGYPPGDYEIYTVQFLLTDEALLPGVGEDGYAIFADISAGLYCAFLTGNVCGIEPDLPNVDMDWDAVDELCVGVVYNFNVVNYDPNYTYPSSVSSGGFSQFSFSDGVLTLSPLTGPISICISNLDDCDDVPDCKVFAVSEGVELPILDGPPEVCINSSFQVSVLNDPLAPLYNWSITGPGIIDSDDNSSITVSPSGAGTITVCANASSIECGSTDDVCIDINVIDPPAPMILADPIYCLPNGFIVGNANGGASSTVYTQISGPGTIDFINPNVVTTGFTVDLPGFYTIVLTKTVDGCAVTDTATFEVIDGLGLTDLDGPLEVCSGTTYQIDVLNMPLAPTYNWTITGPGVIDQDLGSSVIILATSPGTIEVCVTPESTECGTGPEVCFETNVLNGNTPAPQLNEFDFVCIENNFNVFEISMPVDNIYSWLVSGAGMIVSVVSNSEIEVMPTGLGIITICANQIEPICGDGPPTCFDVEVIDPADPEIIANLEECFPGGALSGTLNDASNSVTWDYISGPGNLTFDDPFTLNTNYTVDEAGSYLISLTENNLGCVRSDTIEVLVLEEIETEVVVTCLGSSFTIQITFLSGSAPYSVFGTPITGNIYTSPEYASGSAVVTPYNDSNNCFGQYFTQTFCDCISDAGTMDQTPIEICGEDDLVTALADGNAVLEADDIGIYFLHDSPTDNLGTIFQQNTTGEFGFVAPMVLGQTYYISYAVGNDLGGTIDFNDLCFSVAIGQPVTWYPEISVEIALLPDTDDCDFSFQLSAITDPDINPEVSTWTVVSTPVGGSAVFSTPSSQSTLVNVDQAGTYIIQFNGVEGPCIFEDQYTLVVDQPLEILSEDINCAMDGSTYNVSLVVIGTEPIFINGELYNGTSYVSNDYNSGDIYNLNVTDVNGCSIILQGVGTCGCTSDAGTMSIDLIEVCGDGQVIGLHDGNQVFDGNDGFTYVLHDSPNNFLGNIFDTNNTGIFDFNSPLQYDQIYYISYVVGNDVAGMVDLNDPCLSVAVGQPVIWFEQPVPIIPADIGICDMQVDLEAITNAGSTFDWQVISQPAGSNPTVINNSSLITSVAFDVAGFYEIVFSAANGSCIGQDTIVVEVFEGPSIINYSENCNSGFYTISFEIDSDSPSFLINGVSQSSNTFTSASILSGDAYSFEIEDSNGCTAMIQGTVDCECTSDAGTMNTTLLESCGIQDTFMISLNGDSFLDNDNIGVYVLHDGSGTALGDIIRIQDSNMFEFDNDVQIDVIYYVSYVVGNPDVSGGIDLNDPCLSIADGTPIIWRSIPISEYQDSIAICDGQLMIASTELGDNISELSVIQLQGPVTANIDGNVNSVTIDFATAGGYLFEYNFSDGLCQNTDSLYVNYQPLVISDIVEICNPDNATYQVSFSITSGFEPFSVNGNLIMGNTFTSLPILSGDNYSFVVSDGALCDSIVLDGILSCGCENDAGDLDNTLVELCEGDSYDLTYLSNPTDSIGYDNIIVLHDGTNSSIGSIYQIYSSGVIDYNTSIPLNTTLLLSPISAPFDGSVIDTNDPCFDIGQGTPIIWNEIASVELILPTQAACEGDTAIVQVQILGVPYPFEFYISNSGVQDTFIVNSGDQFDLSIADVNVDEYMISLGDYPCISPDSDLNFNIAVASCICEEYSFLPIDSICSGVVSIDLDDWKNEVSNGIWSVVGGTSVILPSLNGSILNIQNTSTGTVLLNWLPTDSISCDSVYSFELFVENYQEIFLFDNQLQFCPQTSNVIILNDLLSNPFVSGTWITTPFIGGLIGANGSLNIGELEAGTYTLEYMLDESPLYCEQEVLTLTINITEPPNYIVSSNNPDCFGEDGSLNIELIDGNTDIANIFVNDNELSFPYDLGLAPGFYEIEITDENFCSYLEEVEIIEPDEFEVRLDTLSIQNQEENELSITASLMAADNVFDITWFEDGVEILGSTNNEITIQLVDSTVISVLVTDENGCTAEDLIFLSLTDIQEEIEISIPNIFSPISTSGNNLFFIPPNNQIKEVYDFIIYDRWGNKVYSASNFDPQVTNQSWDGTMNGQPCDSGVYVYSVSYLDVFDQEQSIFGDVTLIR